MRSWLMLGSGAIARECFLPAFEYRKDLSALTVVDLAIPAGLREAYPQIEFIEGDYRQALENLSASAAVVTLPNQFHEDAVVRLLEKGVHVLCEKPLGLTEASCLRMQEAAAASGRRLAVNMVRRLFPSVRTAAQLIRDGQIGQLAAIEIQHGGPFSWPAQSLGPFLKENGGVFADMGVHYLDIAESIAGELDLVSYKDDSRGGVEAEASAELRSRAGVTVEIHLSRLRTLGNTVTIVGSGGRLVLPVDSMSSLSMYLPSSPEGIEIHPLSAFRSSSLPVSFAACFVDQLGAFSDRIQARDVSTDEAAAAARYARIIETAYRMRAPEAMSRSKAASFSPALITGVTGFIGSRLVERMYESGDADLSGLVRRPQTCAPAARFPIKLSITDIVDYAAVRKAMEGRRYAFHLAYGRDGSGTDEATVKGTENVVNAAIEAGCEAVVVLSTINVIGWPEGEVDESAPYKPAGGSYGKTKAVMERWCLERARSSGSTRIVVLLPSCVYGPGGKTFTELPAKLAGERSFSWIANGQGLVNYVYIDNLIDAMFLAASSEAAHGQRFIVNDGWTTWREFLAPMLGPWLDEIPNAAPGELKRREANERRGALKRALKAAASDPEFRREVRQSPLSSVARSIAATAGLTSGSTSQKAATLVDVSACTHDPAGAPAWLEDLFGIHPTKFSSAKARAVLGWTPQITLAHGQRISTEHLIAAGLHPAPLESAVA